MLENFLPHVRMLSFISTRQCSLRQQEHQDRPGASRAINLKKKKDTSEDKKSPPASTGAWSPEISVTRVTWQSGSGLARAPLLASATASGLCRIDWLLGRFAQNRFPYKNIEFLRGEIEGAEDEDEVEEAD